MAVRVVEARPTAVHDVQATVSAGGHSRIVGDHDDGQPRAVRSCFNGVRTCLLVVLSRLPVGSSASGARGFGDQGTGNGHPLLLAAESWYGRWWLHGRSNHQTEHLKRQLVGSTPLGVDVHGRFDVLEGGHGGDQIEGLEDDADHLVADTRQAVFRLTADLETFQLHKALGRAVNTGQYASRVDLPEPDGPVSATHSPSATEKDIPRNICKSRPPVVILR